MEITQLEEGNRIRREIDKLQQIITRMECGSNFFSMKFIGTQNKTMEAIEENIISAKVHEFYHKSVNDRLEELRVKFAAL